MDELNMNAQASEVNAMTYDKEHSAFYTRTEIVRINNIVWRPRHLPLNVRQLALAVKHGGFARQPTA